MKDFLLFLSIVIVMISAGVIVHKMLTIREGHCAGI